MPSNLRTWFIRVAIALAILASVVSAWRQYRATDDNEALVSGNGRIEAVDIDIAAKAPGRVKDILVEEGDFVTDGQVVARMDTDTLEAKLHQAEAQLRRAESGVATARSQVSLREAEKAAAVALLAQREAELRIARKSYERAARLAGEGAMSQQEADDAEARLEGAAAAVTAVESQIAAAEASIVAARAAVEGAISEREAVQANIERIQADIADSVLKAPRDGRVQFLVARPGEVVGAGGRVVSMIDLKDVYMTFFLPTGAVGRIAMGSEVRLVLDAAPEYVIPANVSFIADEAQFTPKTVETEVEREKMMFRVRAQIPPDLLEKHILQVKTGLPGVAWVRLDPDVPWPEDLQVNVPE